MSSSGEIYAPSAAFRDSVPFTKLVIESSKFFMLSTYYSFVEPACRRFFRGGSQTCAPHDTRYFRFISNSYISYIYVNVQMVYLYERKRFAEGY